MADALSNGDRELVDDSIEDYSEQMKTLLRGVGGTEENSKALILKIIQAMQTL